MTLSKVAGAKLLSEFRYNNDGDVAMRLKGTIVRYMGVPVYVNSTQGNYNIWITDLQNLSEFEVHSSDEALDISSVPVGWCNSNNGGLIYMMRQARNSQKQGVSPNSLQIFMPGRGLDHFHFQSISDLVPLSKMILNNFPGPSETAKAPQGGAFDREWAIFNPNYRENNNYFTLYHKSIPVGTYFAKTKTFFFRKGRLTKVRRASLTNITQSPSNTKGGPYAIQEQL